MMWRELVRPASLARSLNMAGAGMLSQPARQTLLGLVEAQFGGGYGARDGAMALYEQARSALAALVGAGVDEISFQPSVSAVVSMMAASLSLRPGDQVLSWAAEYPSNVRAWAERTRACGAELVLADGHHVASVADLAQCVTESTRVVVVSSIQSLDGTMVDLPALRAACDRVGALLMLDVSQHLGVVPFDFKASGADFAYGVSHKWLLGPPGVAVLMARRDQWPMLQTQVHGTGNYQGVLGRHFDPGQRLREDIGRLEGGTPPLMAALAVAASARALQAAGIESVQQAALKARQVIAKVFEHWDLEPMGWQGPAAPVHSPIIAFDVPDRLRQPWMQGLEREGVQYIERGGVLRFSPWGMAPAELDEMQSLLERAGRPA